MTRLPERLGVDVVEIDAQREQGWPDFHPEDYCHRCGGRNVKAWFAPSPLWNAVMRDATTTQDGWQGIVCPQCFTELAAERGIVGRAVWQLRTDSELLVEVPMTSPDGRVWDDARSLWVEAG